MCCDLHLTDEETGAQESSKLPKFTQITVAELGFTCNQEVGRVGSLWKHEENLSHASPGFQWLLATLLISSSTSHGILLPVCVFVSIRTTVIGLRANPNPV